MLSEKIEKDLKEYAIANLNDGGENMSGTMVDLAYAVEVLTDCVLSKCKEVAKDAIDVCKDVKENEDVKVVLNIWLKTNFPDNN